MDVVIDEDVARQLREQHAAAPEDYAKATVEQFAMLAFKRAAVDAGKSAVNKAVVADMLGIPLSVLGDRAFLYRAGEAAEPLWKRVSQDMFLNTAVELLRKARHLLTADGGTSLKAAVVRVLGEYDALPQVRRFPNGKQRRFPAEAGRGPRAPYGSKKNAKKRVQSRQTEPTPSSSDDMADRTFWTQVRTLSSEYAQRRLPGHPPEQVEAVVRSLETDLKIVFDTFGHRVQGMTRQTPLSVAVLRRQVRDACRVLHVDPPHKLSSVSERFFSQAQKQFKALARAYHPDTHGTDATRPQFDAVMEAWGIIQQFRDSLGAS